MITHIVNVRPDPALKMIELDPIVAETTAILVKLQVTDPIGVDASPP